MTDRDNDRRVSARRRAEEHKTFDRTAWKLPDGVSSFNITAACSKELNLYSYFVGEGNPYASKGFLHYERTFFTHRGIGPNNDTYVCPAKTAKQKCPVCEWTQRENARGGLTQDEIKNIKSLYPKERQLFLVHDLAAPDKPFQIWDYSFHLFGKQLDARIKLSKPQQGYEYFADPKEGKTILVSFAEKPTGFGKPCYEAAAFDFLPRDPVSKAFTQSLPCLDDLLIILPYKDLRELFMQTAEETPPVEGDDAGTTGTNPAPKAGRRPDPAPAADASDWDEEETTPAPAKAPPKKKAVPAQPAAEAADDDWESPPDEAPTPAPKKKPAEAKPAPAAVEATEDDWENEVPAAPPAKPKGGGKKTTPAPAAAADDDWED